MEVTSQICGAPRNLVKILQELEEIRYKIDRSSGGGVRRRRKRGLWQQAIS